MNEVFCCQFFLFFACSGQRKFQYLLVDLLTMFLFSLKFVAEFDKYYVLTM
jgi:hypothetical protein